MLSRLRGYFRAKICGWRATPERQKEAALPSESHPGRESWRRHSEFQEGAPNFLEEMGCRGLKYCHTGTGALG